MSDFQEHLKRIKLSRERAAEILKIWLSAEEAAVASLAFAWERLFDTLCNNEDISLSDLNTISGVIQKLSAVYNNIKQNKDDDKEESIISPEEVIKRAEEQLKLL